MEAFEYASPRTLKEAIEMLSPRWGQTELLAGGTDLLSLMKDYVVSPQRVINLKGIRELRGIESTSEGLRIGAMVTLDELLNHRTVRGDFPALLEAAEGVTSPQMRNMGTVGGDLCQRPRCWYFRSGYGLLAQDEKGQELVPQGDNRYHAILGNSGPAYFVNASSLAPPLIALGAKVRLTGPQGSRELPLANFYVIPKNDKGREHTMAPNEILTDVIVPAPAGLLSSTYEVRQRELMDWPLATASVAVKLDGGKVSTARIVMGHVAPMPWPAGDAEKWLAGKSLNEETAAQVGELAVREAKPLSRNAYKVQLARTSVKRALLACVRGRQAQMSGAA